MIYAVQALYPLDLDSPCSDSLMDFQLDINVELSMNFLKVNCLAHVPFVSKQSIRHGDRT